MVDIKGTSITGVRQVCINVHDAREAAGFYRDVLGLSLLFEIPKAAFFDCGGVRLYLAEPEKPEFDHPSSVVYFSVPDIHGATKLLKDKGVHFESAPHAVGKHGSKEIWLAFFRDRDNNLLALNSEIDAA